MSRIADLVTAECEQLLDEISAAETHVDELKARFDTLEEIDRLAKQLDGGEEAPAADKVPPAERPAPPARRRAHKATSGGRRSTPSEGGSMSRPAGGTRASGASAAGRRAVAADDIVDDVKAALRKLGRGTPTSIGAELHYSPGSSGLNAVREVVGKLLADGEVKVDGNVRGRPAYSLASAAPARPTMPRPPAINPIDKMLERIERALKENGPRDREDLKERVEEDGDGDVFEEEYSMALDRGVTLKRIQKVQQQGDKLRIVYRLMGGK